MVGHISPTLRELIASFLYSSAKWMYIPNFPLGTKTSISADADGPCDAASYSVDHFRCTQSWTLIANTGEEASVDIESTLLNKPRMSVVSS